MWEEAVGMASGLAARAVARCRGDARTAVACRSALIADSALAERYLSALVDNARLPHGSEVRRFSGTFEEAIAQGPEADLQVLGLQKEPNYAFIEGVVASTGTTCLFAMDSGLESALA